LQACKPLFVINLTKILTERNTCAIMGPRVLWGDIPQKGNNRERSGKMGKGQWIVWLLLLVITLAGCGTEAEVVTSEIVFEEESESDSITVESENEAESESNPPRVALPFETVSYRVSGGDFYNEDPVLIRSVEDFQTIAWGKEEFLWDYEKQANVENWEDIIFFSVESLGENQYDETFFENHDLLLIPTTTGSGMYTVRVTDFMYVPESDSYEVNLRTENKYFAVTEDVGVWLGILEVEKGLLNPSKKEKNYSIQAVHVNVDQMIYGESPDGINGVRVLSGAFEPWKDETSGTYGLIYNAYWYQGTVKIAYHQNGFEPPAAFKKQTLQASDGRVITVGYDEDGTWLWMDFGHVSGCYGATNEGLRPIEAREWFQTVLRTDIGVVSEEVGLE